ncbi:MAG: hypothetical protein ACOYOS_16820 [Syntrophales bacterium]
MFDNIFIELHQKKIEILKSGIGTCNTEVEKSLHSVFETGDIGLLWGRFQTVAEENIRATLRFKEHIAMAVPKNDSDTCLFVHGSTGRGFGQIAPNIDFELTRPLAEPHMRTRVIPECRDDLDLVLIARDPMDLMHKARQAASDIAKCRIGVTVNVVSWDDILVDLKSPDTPAIRRILLFNHPKALIGANALLKLTAMAVANQTWLDIPHEADFRLLMQLAGLLAANGEAGREFTTSELLMLFPTLYLACTSGIHIGFPVGRTKIKDDGVCSEELGKL